MTVFSKNKLDKAPTAYNLKKMRIGTIVRALMEDYVGRTSAPHRLADATNPVGAALATNASQGTTNTYLNSLKTKLNAHYVLAGGVHDWAGYHFGLGFGAPHLKLDPDNGCATANATDAATTYALLNALKAKYNLHRVRLIGTHHVADATNAVSSADADDEAKSVTLANELKADLNAHIADVTHGHFQADGLNSAITTADATNAATALTLANVIKTLYNAHIEAYAWRPIPSALCGTTDASDLATSIELVNALKGYFNIHIADTTIHYQADTYDTVTGDAAVSTLAQVITLANLVRTAFDAHCARKITTPGGEDISTLL